jgi:hypothetical protein
MSFQTGSIDKNGLARTEDGKLYVTSVGTAAITGGTITGTNVPYVLSSSGIPFINISTGSIGNNGALTGVTALPRTFSGGAYCYFPANAIAAGVAAGWYWTVFSSTTAGTIYNSTYTSGTPAVGVTTAFATTGPGAYTGETGEVAVRTLTVPAGALGANGGGEVVGNYSANNTANNKSTRVKLGASYFLSLSRSSETGGAFFSSFHNTGVATAQIGGGYLCGTGGAAAGAPGAAAQDTTGATTLTVASLKVTATDNHIIEDVTVRLYYAA